MVTVVAAFLILLIGIFAASAVIEMDGGSGTGAGTGTAQDAALLDGPGTYVSIRSDRTGTNETVFDSRGYAMNFSGSPGSNATIGGGDFYDDSDNWTVATWARTDTGATFENGTVLATQSITLYQNRTAGTWNLTYYNTSNRETYATSVNAPDQPASWAHLLIESNGTHVTLWRNNTASSTINVTGTSSDAYTVSQEYNGRVEETRTWNATLTATERQRLIDSPIDPEANASRTGRIMYDEPYRSYQYVFHSATELNYNNVEFSDGFAGENLTATGNYTWDTNGPRIRPEAGGELDTQPVAYVDYNYEDVFGPHILVDPFESAIGLAVIVPILAILAYFIFIFGDLRGGGRAR
jgi:hypothetical protein